MQDGKLTFDNYKLCQVCGGWEYKCKKFGHHVLDNRVNTLLSRGEGVSMADIEKHGKPANDPIGCLLEKVDEIQEAIEALQEGQEEVIEKLSNLSLPGVDYSIREDV